MAAIKDLFKGSTEAKIADVQGRLNAVQTELDELNLGTAPTSDLDAEEANALRRLARKEALGRVSSALSAELAELKNKHAQEVEEEKQRQAAKLRVKIDKARSAAADAIWTAYESANAWKVLDQQMEGFHAGYGAHGRAASNIADQLESTLSTMSAIKVTLDGRTMKRTVERVNG